MLGEVDLEMASDEGSKKRKRDDAEQSSQDSGPMALFSKSKPTHVDANLLARLKDIGLDQYPRVIPSAKAVADVFGLAGWPSSEYSRADMQRSCHAPLRLRSNHFLMAFATRCNTDSDV